MKAFGGLHARARRGEPTDEDELRPLAQSEDWDAMDEFSAESPGDDGDRFSAPPATTASKNGFVNGDMYKEKPEPEPEIRCGYGTCRPEALQCFNNPKWLLTFLCFFSMAQGFVVNGINNVSTTSVERRFQLPSSRVGMISSSYDLSAAILGIFISYMGSGRQKAKWLSMASVTMAVGSFVMALPHFTSGKYEWGRDIALTCRTTETEAACKSGSDLQDYLYVLILGQLLHGLGGTTLYTVGVSLIDDSVPAASSPMYIGIMYAFATLGPAMGYILGGQLLEIYVDFDTVQNVDILSDDPRWVGAWWVGFVIASVLFLVAAIPISLYGAELPSAKHVRETRVSEMHGDDGSLPVASVGRARKLSDLRHMPSNILKLLKNPTFLFITLAGSTEGMITSGFATFMPKFIQNQFGVTAGWAAMLTGFMAVPGAAGGQFFGGYLCKRLKLKVRGCIRVAIVCSSLAVLISVALWTKCDPGYLAGVTQQYTNGTPSSLPALNNTCNSGCGCHTELYEPVCDQARGIQYFSPCYAGCLTQASDGKSYSNCSCVAPNPGVAASTVDVGKCSNSCTKLYIFLPLIFVAIFLLFTPSPPAVAATLRCVHEGHRTLGLGLKWLIVRLLGTVPGPIFFGAIIDSTCVIWREKCGEHASCWIYDNDQLSRNFFILVLCFKVVSITFFIFAHQLYKAPQEKVVAYNVNGEIASVDIASQNT
ncbi:solute carrier organic anion transporter family member 4C1-like isoform X2 [Mya arenaria]|uniref:solute carrier organic anion transporter family member 4C1-like isoform X2 n=1 Tax=Mya arenaria TaxID=6604 RepID=UPI0022E028AA|nr:solute carrier organic anion transporter family member 4C1-like isoform X2 [Mya arenaria]